MSIRRSAAFLFATSVLVPASPAIANDDWQLRGSATTRYSDYNTSGNPTASPYAATGDMFFNEFNIYLDRKDGEYSRWQGEISGVYNPGDDYRTREFGFTPERINLTREDGDAGLPYRIELGDYFSYYSYMTLQQSLKGLQIELQPFSDVNRQHSILLTSGSNQPEWREFSSDEDYFNAISWVVSDRSRGTWGLNYVHNTRDGSRSGRLDRSQSVASLSGDLPLIISGQHLRVQGEFSAFRGDHDGTTDAQSGQDQNDTAWSLAVSGRSGSLPLEYKLRLEAYGQDYRPRGAIIIADRKLAEFRAGWLFDSGLRLQGRAQNIEERQESSNPFRTRMLGFNLSGLRLDGFYDGLNARIDAYTQNNNDARNSVDYFVKTLTINLNAPLGDSVQGRLDAFIQDLDSDISRTQDNRTSEMSLAVDFPMTLGRWDGYLSSGVTARLSDTGVGDRDEYSLLLSFQMGRQYHSVSFNYGGLRQDRQYQLPGQPDVRRQNLGLDYRYDRGRHTLGLEAAGFLRDPDPGDNTDAWLVSAYWTYRFEERRQQPLPGQSNHGYGQGVSQLDIDLAGLAPGARAGDVEQLLTASNLTSANTQSGWLVYESRLLPDVFQRQRLLVDYYGGVVRRSAVVINFDDVGDTRNLQQIFTDVQQQLINKLGRPQRNYNKGEFSPALIADLGGDRFVRISEWDTGQGVLRFGIPRRLDGQVRMELQYTRTPQSMNVSHWSIDAVN